MKIVRNIIGCGNIAKSVRLQIFLDAKMYFEILQEAKALDIKWRNDSELIRKILFKFFNDLPMQTLQIETLKQQKAQLQSVIDELEHKATEQQGKKKNG